MVENVGIVLAGGVGSRFGADRPKQYCQIFGKEMIWYSIEAFRQAKSLDAFFIVADDAMVREGRLAEEYGVDVIAGGKTRNGSFKNALDYIRDRYPDCQKVIENNAACPMITPELVDAFMGLLDENDFVESAYKITDALGSYEHRIANREDFYLIQAPDAYRFPLLDKWFDANSPLGHPAHQLPSAAVGYRYFDYVDNFKVTYPQDIEIVEVLMNRRNRERNAIGQKHE